MATPFIATASIEFGESDGSPNKTVTISVPASYEALVDQRLLFEGSDTEPINVGTLPAGAKVLLVIYLLEGAPTDPITLRVNGAVSGGVSLNPGGFMLCALSEITSLSLVHTADCAVRIVVLG